ncbi:MAG: BtpA/SgcQ family protein [Nanoarchaeota archaeon]|nr:BtpA/SgcQ family protein [Nanoarchaeota archaeon]MBU4116539.1 BtpA/SgcQ family protein [Nanoarchaeota archaeon]
MRIKKNFVIGALHFSPLIGYKGFTFYEEVLEKAKQDLKSLEDGGVDAIIVENNYNFPHKIKETHEVIEMIIKLAKEIIKLSPLPVGISVLWNDYGGAFKIAKETGAKFIRVPVFVDSVKTDFGEINANPEKVIFTRKKMNIEDILIFADIQVKHAEMIDKNKSLFKSAKEAKDKGADVIIITGKWTGDAPIFEDLHQARKGVGKDFPIIIGSGADKHNINKLFEIADAVIISTSLKEGEINNLSQERNLKHYDAKIDVNKVKEFMESIKNESS